MTLEIVPTSSKECGTVYFCYDYALDSFNGAMTDGCSMDEADIKQFIRASNPDLFERLYGLPFASNDIPLGFGAQKRLKRAYEMHKTMDAVSQKIGQKHTPSQHSRQTQESKLQATSNSETHIDLAMLELQLQRHMQTCLLNGHSLVLEKVPPTAIGVCSGPACPLDNIMCTGRFHLTLKQDMFPFGYIGLSEVSDERSYCLACLEDVFDGRQAELDAIIEQVTTTKDDCVDHNSILKAATRLYQAACSDLDEDAYIDERTVPTTIVPASLKPTTESRLAKKDDIESTLEEVEKYERSRDQSRSIQDGNGAEQKDGLPNLQITRPAYMEAPKERYKKQGRSRCDKESLPPRKLKIGGLPDFQNKSASLTSDESAERICYCREEDLQTEELVRCENEWCSIGWFHPRCIGLNADVVVDDISYLCRYCKDDFGPFEPMLLDSETEDITAANDVALEQADRLADDEDTNIEDILFEDMLQDNEDQTLEVPALQQWGIPINFQPQVFTIDDCEFEEDDSMSPAPVCTEDLDRLDKTAGFTSTTQFDPLNISNTTSLFPGSSRTKFVDLGPFISTQDLSATENKIFDQWKRSLPPSRLVQALVKSERGNSDAALIEIDDIEQPPDNYERMRLSELLDIGEAS